MANAAKRPWFGRRKIGFGWGPVSWQGWVVSVGMLGALMTLIDVLRR